MKEGRIAGTGGLSAEELEQINQLTRRPFTEAELYTFSLVLCDNEIDRDREQFAVTTLQELATLFVGKTGIFDHSMRGKDQKARIFSAAVERVDGKTNAAGEPYYRLTAKAYMLRNRENEGLIGEIDAGIKKEVSVGVAIGERICSICGRPKGDPNCRHQIGQMYEGKQCYCILRTAKDAYEWSFVAVPAQPKAGVMKSFKQTREETGMEQLLETLKSGGEAITLSAAQRSELTEQLLRLEEEAKLGQAYKNRLRGEVEKLLPIAMPEMDSAVFGRVAQVMTVEELQSFHSAFAAEKKRKMPPVPQLAPEKAMEKTDDTYFKI